MDQRDVGRNMRSARVELRRLARTTSVAVLLLVVSACGVGWQDQQISMVEVLDDERTLVVGYHCHHDASIEAEETSEVVRLSMRVYGGSRGDCAEGDEVEVDAPLAGRTVIDTSNDAEIVPCGASASPAGRPCS